jgi:DNA-binding MarR family transcriptional regulator
MALTDAERRLLRKQAAKIRRDIVDVTGWAGGSHIGGSLSMTDIAQRMGHSTAATTGIVDRLEKLGHVRRSNGLADRRKIFVLMTPSGSALVGKVHDDMVTNLLKMMNALEPGERKSWLQIYEKIFTYCRPT